MPRYIDVDFLAKFPHWENVVKQLECAPTVDAQEVKHGKWIETMLDKYRKVECKCSVCGWSGIDNYDSYVDIATFDHCPNCGARMDGDEE